MECNVGKSMHELERMQLMARADRRVPLTSHSFQRLHLFAHIAFHMILYSDSNMNPQKKNGENSAAITENAKWCFNSSLQHWFVMHLQKLWHHSIGHNWLSFSIVLLLFMPIEKGLTSNWNYITHKQCRSRVQSALWCNNALFSMVMWPEWSNRIQLFHSCTASHVWIASKAAVNHARMRMELSFLNAQRFAYNLIYASRLLL